MAKPFDWTKVLAGGVARGATGYFETRTKDAEEERRNKRLMKQMEARGTQEKKPKAPTMSTIIGSIKAKMVEGLKLSPNEVDAIDTYTLSKSGDEQMKSMEAMRYKKPYKGVGTRHNEEYFPELSTEQQFISTESQSTVASRLDEVVSPRVKETVTKGKDVLTAGFLKTLEGQPAAIVLDIIKKYMKGGVEKTSKTKEEELLEKYGLGKD